MMNGGLGLALERAPNSKIIAYAGFAGVMGVEYLAVIVLEYEKKAAPCKTGSKEGP